MFPASTVVSTLLLVNAVAAGQVNVIHNSGITLPFAVKLKLNGSSIADIDRSRAAALKRRIGKGDSSFPVTNAGVIYVASVGVGNPATQYNLLIDTGSSNTWIGAGKAYQKTSTTREAGNAVSVTYGSGSFSGEEFTDTVTLSSSLVIAGQSIGVASTSTGFDGVDGILGIGPTDLTHNSLILYIDGPPLSTLRLTTLCHHLDSELHFHVCSHQASDIWCPFIQEEVDE
ncbi:acid protease [Rickenella mellea]|uniref:Acid protease n=1 Tax=Rickenella mellea TaxID=50990 RepID=A0A4Y7PGI1_9AGAM|nr:acid protease [Rickenella mellea]